ncbi:MAG: hypothetical protein M0010_16775 [Actinomycetota bacterium]|nr:hypothetical protein [Actinomycetota bacterium]
MEPAEEEAERGGGDPACWAHLVCPECGAIETDGHREWCSFGHSADAGARPPALA